MAMIRVLMAALLAGMASGQSIISERRLAPDVLDFNPRPHEAVLRCDVRAMKPLLNFSFRFQSGYVASVPMEQYEGERHRWAILEEITPEGGKPVYLISRIRLPNVPKTKARLEFGGGYLLGEGRYKVRWKMWDDLGRTCRSSWTTEVKRNSHERQIRMAIEPGKVAEFTLRGAPALPRDRDDVAPIRLTVLLDAAPVSPHRMNMRAGDQVMLIGALSSLLERVPTRSVRLVVFNLDQQKELFRREDFKLDSMGQVAQAIRGLQLGLVDYAVLKNRRGHVDLLADLVKQEIASETPSDVVLFLGPTSRFTDKVPIAEAQRLHGDTPRFFYFECKPFLRQTQASLPDSIHAIVSRLRGKSVVIRSPGDFANAIAQMERLSADR